IARGTLSFSYDPATGNLSSSNAPDGINLTYAYDGGLFRSQTWSGPITGTTSYTYDNNFRWTAINWGGNPIALRYENDGLLTQVGALSLTHQLQNTLLTGSTLISVTDALVYNNFGEPISFSAAYMGSPLFTQQFGYNQLGQILT